MYVKRMEKQEWKMEMLNSIGHAGEGRLGRLWEGIEKGKGDVRKGRGR